jgi:hypothetical protein
MRFLSRTLGFISGYAASSISRTVPGLGKRRTLISSDVAEKWQKGVLLTVESKDESSGGVAGTEGLELAMNRATSN